MRIWLATGCLLMFAGVAVGAFGAHGLRDRLDDYHMGVYEKGVLYHLVHAVGLLCIASLGPQHVASQRLLVASCALMTIGIVLFSGSLYLLAITGIRWLGAITPLGGVSFLLGWAASGYAMLRG